MRTRTAEELIDHLLANSIYDEDTGCVLWLGCTAGKGYGVTCFESKQVYIHRFAYWYEHPDEEIDTVRHSCDTPACWRIEHLTNGTRLENVQDMVIKKRHMHGGNNYNTTLDESKIVDIRNSNLNLYELGNLYNVTPSTIHYIKTRKTWKHVP